MRAPHTCHIEQLQDNEVQLRFACHSEADASELFNKLSLIAKAGMLDIRIRADKATVTTLKSKSNAS